MFSPAVLVKQRRSPLGFTSLLLLKMERSILREIVEHVVKSCCALVQVFTLRAVEKVLVDAVVGFLHHGDVLVLLCL